MLEQFELLVINNEKTDFKFKCFDRMEKLHKEAGIKEHQLECKRCIEMGMAGILISYNSTLDENKPRTAYILSQQLKVLWMDSPLTLVYQNTQKPVD